VDTPPAGVVDAPPADDSASDNGRLIIVANRPGISEAAVMHKVVGLDANRVDEPDTCCASAVADGRKLFETDGVKEPPVLYKLEDRVMSGIISWKALMQTCDRSLQFAAMLSAGVARMEIFFISFHQLLFVRTKQKSKVY